MFQERTQYQLVDGDEKEDSHQPHPDKSGAQSTLVQISVLLLLVVSIGFNIGIAIERETRSTTYRESPSKYAGLTYNTPRPFQHSTEYSSSNATRMQELWDSINFDKGMIYITPAYADSMDLLPTQNFPWDPELKIYLLNGHHNLHCLQSIQKSLAELTAGETPTYPMAHVMHCLDTLRDDVMCHADDTPRYTTTSPEAESGMGQMRQCRDWTKLEAWAEQYSGCWHYINAHYDQRNELERWRFCEPGAPYYDRVQKWTEKHQGELA